MCNVGKRSAVHQCRRIFECLHQIRLDGVFQERRHRAYTLQIAREHRFAAVGVSHQNIAEPLFQVVYVRSKAQNCHNFAGDGNHKVIFTRYAVDFAAQPHNNIAKRAVIHIETAFQENTARVNPQFVALL